MLKRVHVLMMNVIVDFAHVRDDGSLDTVHHVSVNIRQGHDGEVYMVFSDTQEMDEFMDSTGYSTDDTHCFGGGWDDNALRLSDFCEWAEAMEIQILEN